MRRAWWGVLLVWVSVSSARAEEVLVFAAASATDALQALAPAFQQASGHRVRFAFGASSDLARQVVAGAPADAFLSADEAKLDVVDRAGLVQAGSRVDLLSNRLVVVVPVKSAVKVAGPADLKGLKRVVLAEPAAVPAGVYAKAWLTKAGVWADVAPRVVPAVDVRAALAAVEAGRADAGVVYATDAAQSKKVRVAFTVPEEDAPRIVYPAAALTQGKAPQGGLAFVRFLQTEGARKEFHQRGFLDASTAKAAPDAGVTGTAPDAGVPRALPVPKAGAGTRKDAP
ncbi:molybdate ABC transporter periplasmic molybdate-binding protein [Corallococcus coralloides DSM 2259]|uniref:Molybdate ABC transporter periplasmic molybdate-binding protein n=1 Tax=Corallococcus coralloides (strain ATCC 25202 / DSM 2259 / NBRC 100086 / M2) TaxID=1144275 RepID=H8MJV4_CORCM|nr:molybdate ABC transporter substrate-binding protein [Corallococcus coralloides]AFE09461.1 molybdate ABC transporter periplasmic molybdate-binding protein [Corallococcus coralloides DSM 2259]